jgi:hypothetical protein
MSIKLSVAKISKVNVGLFRPLPSVKLRASLQTLRQSQGSWESFLESHEIDEKETTAGARSIRDKGKGVVAIGNCGTKKSKLWDGIREWWLKSLVEFRVRNCVSPSRPLAGLGCATRSIGFLTAAELISNIFQPRNLEFCY